MFSPGIEPGTFCVLDRCDNRYTTKTLGSEKHVRSMYFRVFWGGADFCPSYAMCRHWETNCRDRLWLGPCVVAAVTQVRILVTAFFFYPRLVNGGYNQRQSSVGSHTLESLSVNTTRDQHFYPVLRERTPKDTN